MASPATVAPVSLRAALDQTCAALRARLAEPGQGAAAGRAIADVYDHALAERFDAACATAAPGVSLALVATGGWARRDLAPYSDLDFIVLHDRDEAAAKRVSDTLLYPLWDEKLAIGPSIREPRAAARLARDDLATATALLDARHIAGRRTLSTELARVTLDALAPGGNPNDLIAALAAEKKARHDRFGASLYLLEPNLKQGIGALRDLATAVWCAQVRWHPPRPGIDPVELEQQIQTLARMEHLNHRQMQVLLGARDFQLRLRALVQLTARRRFDQLTFEIQEAIAPALYPDAKLHDGDVRPAVAPAVEALMREYYLHARQVVQIADALLESARVPGRKKPRVGQVDASFITINGELAIRAPRMFVDKPSEMIRLFRVAVAEQLPVYGATRELVADTIARDPEPLARDPDAGPLLLQALADVRDSGQPSAFEVMNQLGILSVVMPEWAPCVGRVQHDLYHVYTVDQHQLYAVAMQKRIARGELVAEHPLATELWREVTRPAPLLLGTLLHDVGKPLGKGHAEKGAVVAAAIARRLGMDAPDIELTEMLVRQHLTMSHLSQRRDLTDPEVIERFAEKIGTDQELVQLYLVTLCDTAMTAPDNLSAWKDGLLRDLMLRTRACLLGQSIDLDDHAKVVELVTPRQAARLVRLVETARVTTPHIALEVHCYPLKGHSELAIVAPDAPGVLATIAAVLTANRVNVLGAVLDHVDVPASLGASRLVTDVFYVRDLKGEAIAEDDPRWIRLTADLRRLLGSAPDPAAVATLIAERRPRSTLPVRVTPGVVTEIKLHDDSTQATIIEVLTRDRVGVLYAITQTLADLGLDISLAKVTTEGEKVADVFYVMRAGKRITDPAHRAVIVERLHQALDASGLTGS